MSVAVTVTSRPGSIVEIIGELPAEEFESHRAVALLRLKKNIVVPGFRSDHAPEAVLRNTIGPEKILVTMAKIALDQLYPQIIAEHKLDVIGRPTLSIMKLADRNPLGFKLTMTVLPQIKLPDYRAIARAVNQQSPETTDPKNRDKQRLQLMKQLVEAGGVTVPDILVQAEKERLTEADLRGDWEKLAAERVATSLILDAIRREEKLTLPESELEATVEELTRAYPKVSQAALTAYARDRLENELVLQFLEKQV